MRLGLLGGLVASSSPDIFLVELGSEHIEEVVEQKQRAEMLGLTSHAVLFCPLAYFRFLHELECRGYFPRNVPRDGWGNVARFLDLDVLVGGERNVELLIAPHQVVSHEYVLFRNACGFDGGITARRR